jgi:hypothetical protein
MNPAQPGLELKYVDRPEVSETFVDLLQRISIHANVARLEFTSVRVHDPLPGRPTAGTQITACRLALPLEGLLQMGDQINNLIRLLEQQGAIKRVAVVPQTPSGKPN